jgi:hypothetical protein
MENTIKIIVDKKIEEFGVEELLKKTIKLYGETLDRRKKFIEYNRPLLNTDSHLEMLLSVMDYLEKHLLD